MYRQHDTSLRRLKFVAVTALGLLTLGACERSEEKVDVTPATGAIPTEGPAPMPEVEDAPSRSDQYSVSLKASTLEVGETAEVDMVIVPGPNLKINLDFPWKIEFEETEGITLTKRTFSKGDIRLEEPQATVPLRIQAQEAGQHTLKAVANFSVCNDDRCDILRGERLTVALEVAGADTP